MHPVLAMLSGPELFVAGMIILLLFGAKKLPDLARGMGKSVSEFKKARDEAEAEEAVEKEQKKS